MSERARLPQRSRNAAATRQAMLVAARRQFARESYENVGLREIAGEVGVDPALVCRYFGSKEELFREILQGDDPGGLFEGVEADGLAAHLVALIMDRDEDGDHAAAKLDQLLIILRSASSLKASAIVREAIEEAVLEPIASRLGGNGARVRASLALTVLMGSGIVRNVMTVASICEGDETVVRRRLLALFEAALTEL